MSDFNVGRLTGGFVVTWPDASCASGRRRYRLKATTREAAYIEARQVYTDLTGPVSLSTVAEVWEAYRKDKDGRAIAETMKHTGKAVLRHFGSLGPMAITAEDCRGYTAARRALGIHDGSTHTELGHLRTALTWAAKPGRRLIPEAVEIERPQKPEPKDRFLTRDEADRLLAAATAPHIRLAIVLMLSTVGRVGAILDLTWDRVDFEQGQINLRLAADRPRKGRAIAPMNRTARAALMAAREGALSDHVIEWGGEPVRCILKGVKSAAARAGLKDVSPHCLRHTAAVWMLTAGYPIGIISRLLGHSNTATTERVYAKWTIDSLRDAAAVLEFGGLMVVK